MVDSKTVRDIYKSLNSGEKKFEFSQLREALREASIDVENFNLEQNNDQQALLCVAEKFLLDAQQEGGATEFDESLVHASAYEGVGDSENIFLYPMTSLTCNILNGQRCSLRKRILQPALLFEPQTTVDEGYWQQWERAFNRSLVRLYSKSQKISVLSEKRELNLC